MVVACPDLRCPDLRCPDLRRPDLSPGPDAQAARRHERVIAAVTGFCPDVEVVEPGVCAFGARGPARYFGGEAALAARIIAAVADLGTEAAVGVADGLFAALLAARDGTTVPPGGTARFLAAEPVSVLPDQDLAALLSRLGLGTLGHFAALPVRDVASRFGAAGEYAHRLARGLDSRPLATRPPPADLSVAHRLGPRADLRPGADHGRLGRRAGEQQALAARRAAVRDRGGRTGPLAARRMAACPSG